MKKLHKTLIAAFIITGLVSYTFAEDEQTVIDLDIDTAVSYALDTHIDIKRQSITLKQSERSYKHSWNNVLPSVSASAAAGDGAEFSSDQNMSLSTSISASVNLSSGLGFTLKSLKASYESGKKDYEDTVRQVETAVRKSYYGLLYSKMQVELYESNVNSYQTLYNQTEIKKSRGLVPELDLLTAQVNLENAKITLKKSEVSYNASFIEFMTDIGIDLSKYKVNLTGSLDDAYDFANIKKLDIEEAVAESPDMRSLNDSLIAAKLTKNATVASSYGPSLTLSSSVNPYGTSYSTQSSSSVKSDATWSVSASVNFSLDNYIPGSSASDSIQKAKDTIQDLELQIDNKQKTLMSDIISKLQNVEINKDNLDALKLNVDLAKRTYDLTLDAYQKGTKDLTTLQSSLDSYQSTVLQWRSGEYDLISDVLELENLLGVTSGSLIDKQ